MIRIGLTGGMGMGKSTAAQLLAQHGLPVLDSDQVARDVVSPGSPALDEVAQLLGGDVIAPDGSLRRDLVAERVFADEALRKALETILHPRIRVAWQRQLADWAGQGVSRAVVMVPLLYEVNLAGEFDRVVCVACTAATQSARLAPRHWTAEQIRLRNAAQWPVEKKMAQADFVLWSEGVVEVLAAQIDRLLERI
jgi:dephospho-CoA kinase